MSEREFSDMLEAFDLLPAIDAVHKCRSIFALGALKKVIDRRIQDIEQITGLVEQTRAETEQKALKVEKKHHKKERRKYQSVHRVYDENQVLKEYGTNKIYKPVLNVVLRDAKELFTQDDLSWIIRKHYVDVLKRDLTISSADTYAYHYVKYMLSERFIVESGKLGGEGRGSIQYRKLSGKSVESREKELGIINGAKNPDKTKDALRERRQFEEDVCGGTKDMF